MIGMLSLPKTGFLCIAPKEWSEPFQVGSDYAVGSAHRGFRHCSVCTTAEWDSAVSCPPRSLDEIKTKYRTVQRGRGGLESWKKWRSKISWRTRSKFFLYKYLACCTFYICKLIAECFTVYTIGNCCLSDYIFCTIILFVQHSLFTHI